MNANTTPRIMMTRQPIFDHTLKVIAYKLLYRNEESTDNVLFNESELSAQVILDEYTNVFEGGESRSMPAYLHLPAEGLHNNEPPLLPKTGVILEVACDANTNATVALLVEHGFEVALDNFIYNAELKPALQQASVVKIDMSTATEEQVQAILEAAEGAETAVLACNIDTLELLEESIPKGFQFFSGNFLSKPKQILNDKIEANQTATLQLISELQNPDATPESIEQIVQLDPALTYKLMRIVNSVAYSLVREVTEIADTVRLLGFNQVRQLAITIAMSNQSDKPVELYRSILIRSRMCESVAKGIGRRDSGSFFLTGLMSGLHLLFDIEMDKLLEQMPISEEIKLAVVEGSGDIGEVLTNTMHYEVGDWGALPADFDSALYEIAYRESISWAKEVMASTYGQFAL